MDLVRDDDSAGIAAADEAFFGALLSADMGALEGRLTGLGPGSPPLAWRAAIERWATGDRIISGNDKREGRHADRLLSCVGGPVLDAVFVGVNVAGLPVSEEPQPSAPPQGRALTILRNRTADDDRMPQCRRPAPALMVSLGRTIPAVPGQGLRAPGMLPRPRQPVLGLILSPRQRWDQR